MGARPFATTHATSYRTSRIWLELNEEREASQPYGQEHMNYHDQSTQPNLSFGSNCDASLTAARGLLEV